MSLKTATLAFVALFAGPALAQQTILPGYWESTSQATLLSRGDPKVERRCLTAEQVEEFLSHPSTSRYTCTYTTHSVHGGVAHMEGQCVDRHGTSFNVAWQGAYKPESFHLDARLSLPNLAMFNGSASIDAHRISADCPPDAKGSDAAGKEKAPPSPAGPSQ